MFGNTFNPSGGGPFYFVFGAYVAINPLATATTPYSGTIPKTLNMVEWNQGFYVGAANNAANYWTFELKRESDKAIIATINTASSPASSGSLITTSIFLIPTVYKIDLAIDLKATPTGAPGNCYLFGPSLLVS